jgi:F-type H+-transporting ATPase subunit delta
MIYGGLAKRYAVALFEASRKKGITGEMQRDLADFCGVLERNRRFKNFLLSPQILTEEKNALVEKTFGDITNTTFVNFIKLLITKERFDHIEEIAQAYTELYEKSQGIVEVQVTTAIPLDEDLESKAVRKLEEATGKKIRLKKRIDESIIGGMVVRMENKVIDGSVKYHLEKLRSNLKEVRVY